MRRTFVTYLGDPRRPNETEHRIDGMDPWQIGEKREFSDALAAEFDGTSGSDFALMFCHVENANLKVAVFELTERDDEPNDATSTPTTDTPTTSPAANANPATGV